MRGRPPKPPELRQRRNKAPTAATLPSPESMANADVPKLPDRQNKAEVWHPEVLLWWTAVWRSPMASRFVESDIRGGLYTLAELYQVRWSYKTVDELVKVAGRIDALEARFGLAPYDRHRLQWVIEQGEEASERTEKRTKARNLTKATAGKDPRDLLKAVS